MDKVWNDDPLYMGQIEAQAAQIKALQAFKDYVHERLDNAGIPTHPEGVHSAAGCRVGDRLDIALGAYALMASNDPLEQRIVEQLAALNK